MKIVVLDGYTLNPGDLSWTDLEKVGTVEVYDRTAPADILSRAEGAEIILTNKTILTADILAKLPGLRYVGVLATGYNVVDVDAARSKGIIVTNVPDYGTMPVAQHVFALIFGFYNGVESLSQGVMSGRWSSSVDFCYWEKPLTEIAGLTIGIIGFGKIGKAVVRIADAFGMKVIVNDRTDVSSFKKYPVDELLRLSDIISLHCPLTPETRGLINAEALMLMKKTALLVNTARGPLVIEQDLADALNEGRIAGAALDVLSVEPPSPDNPLLSARNCIITPHVAWAALASRKRLMKITIDNIQSFLNSNPVNVVNR